MMRALDLFAGAVGGWTRGLHRAGFTTIAACEIDPWRRAVFAANNPGAVMFDDIRSLHAADIVARCGCLPDIIVGSPPCQDISTANTKGRGVEGERSGLFFEAIRLVRECRPAWVALENSPNLRNRGADRVLGALEDIGYACWPLVVGADDIGANHRRKRVWIVAADPDRQGEHGLAGDGEVGRCLVASAADADELRQPMRHQADAPVTCGDGTKQRVLDGSDGRADARTASDSHEARQPLGSGLAGNDGAQLPPALRDIGLAWPDWQGGLSGLAATCTAAGFGHVDASGPAVLAPGVRNRAIAACGDAVVEVIPFLIGRAILATSGVAP